MTTTRAPTAARMGIGSPSPLSLALASTVRSSVVPAVGSEGVGDGESDRVFSRLTLVTVSPTTVVLCVAPLVGRADVVDGNAVCCAMCPVVDWLGNAAESKNTP